MDGKINNRFFRKETKKWYLSNSKIHGQGVFAAKKIIRGEIIDVAIYLETITPFCLKINHSWNPCAELIFDKEKYIYNLVAIQDINKDQEITNDYRKTPTFIKKPDPNWS